MTTEEKAKAYDGAIAKAQKELQSCGSTDCDAARQIIRLFPELAESEDEKVKRIIHSISNKISFHLHNIFTEEEFQCFDAWSNAWLKKQNKHQQLYIRFGNIPSNEKSKIYRGEEEFGYENGVSVYPAFEDVNGNIVLGLSLPITKTTLYTQQHLIEYDDRLCYLVKGDYVGKGTDGEPLIKNVRIIKEIKPYRMKQDKENNIYIINNTPNCSISVYNEELKESEDARIRKTMSLEKQGEPKQEENDQKCEPFRIKKGKWYVCIHDFCHNGIRIGEIIQAEHDNTIRGIGFLYMENKYFRPAFENEIPQKSKWSEEDEERLQSCIIELQGKGLMGGVDTIDTKWLKALKQRINDNFEKTCKNDTLLDLLNKMPSCITVNGIDYHFVLKKTIAYMAFYEGEGEGSGKVIFWMAGEPIELLTAMLNKLKEEGLLE